MDESNTKIGDQLVHVHTDLRAELESNLWEMTEWRGSADRIDGLLKIIDDYVVARLGQALQHVMDNVTELSTYQMSLTAKRVGSPHPWDEAMRVASLRTEDDEDPAKVIAAFDAGEKHLTKAPVIVPGKILLGTEPPAEPEVEPEVEPEAETAKQITEFYEGEQAPLPDGVVSIDQIDQELVQRAAEVIREGGDGWEAKVAEIVSSDPERASWIAAQLQDEIHSKGIDSEYQTCNKCHRRKLKDDFNKDRSKKSGRKNFCRMCESDAARDRRKAKLVKSTTEPTIEPTTEPTTEPTSKSSSVSTPVSTSESTFPYTDDEWSDILGEVMGDQLNAVEKSRLERQFGEPVASGETRTCTRCQQVKPMEDFGLDRSKKSGHRSMCRKCEAKSKRSGK